MSNTLFDLDEISGETIFIDGTKIEAAEGKNSAVFPLGEFSLKFIFE